MLLLLQNLLYPIHKIFFTHADGTFKEVMETIDTSNAIKVDGYYGDKVPTRGDFKILYNHKLISKLYSLLFHTVIY